MEWFALYFVSCLFCIHYFIRRINSCIYAFPQACSRLAASTSRLFLSSSLTQYLLATNQQTLAKKANQGQIYKPFIILSLLISCKFLVWSNKVSPATLNLCSSKYDWIKNPATVGIGDPKILPKQYLIELENERFWGIITLLFISIMTENETETPKKMTKMEIQMLISEVIRVVAKIKYKMQPATKIPMPETITPDSLVTEYNLL